MSQRAITLFAVLGALSLAVLWLALSRDWTREWHQYQREYRARLVALASSPEEKAHIRSAADDFVQVMVGNERADRCMTCHLAVEDPRFADAPEPLRTHPEIGPHSFQRFGCTICHGGLGRSTSSKEAHEGIVRKEGLIRPSGEADYVEERVQPLLRGDLVYASCPACHLGEDGKGGPLLKEGQALFQSQGCLFCHKIGKVGGQMGPELTFVGEKHTDPDWLLGHFRDPKKYSAASSMPSYSKLSDASLESLTAFMLSLKPAPYDLIAGGVFEERGGVKADLVREALDALKGGDDAKALELLKNSLK